MFKIEKHLKNAKMAFLKFQNRFFFKIVGDPMGFSTDCYYIGIVLLQPGGGLFLAICCTEIIGPEICQFWLFSRFS